MQITIWHKNKYHPLTSYYSPASWLFLCSSSEPASRSCHLCTQSLHPPPTRPSSTTVCLLVPSLNGNTWLKSSLKPLMLRLPIFSSMPTHQTLFCFHLTVPPAAANIITWFFSPWNILTPPCVAFLTSLSSFPSLVGSLCWCLHLYVSSNTDSWGLGPWSLPLLCFSLGYLLYSHGFK